MPLANTKESNSILKNILNFARRCSDNLTRGTQYTILPELKSNITTLCTSQLIVPEDYTSDFDRAGTELWNSTTRLKRDSSNGTCESLATLRVFAFYLIERAKPSHTRTLTNNVRVLKAAHKVARQCLEQHEIDHAQAVLTTAADAIDAAKNQISNNSGKETGGVSFDRELNVEYLTLRIMLAWKQHRLEIANGMFDKINAAEGGIDPVAAEALADLLYEIGKELYRKGDKYNAAKWLERAHQALMVHEQDILSSDAGELRLSIMHLQVRALMDDQRDDLKTKAQQLLALMENEYGSRMPVLILQLDYAKKMGAFDDQKFFAALHKMTRTVHMTPTNVKTILHHVHELKRQNAQLACRLLDDLLILRLFKEKQHDWTEKVLVTRLWIGIDDQGAQPISIKELENLLQGFASNVGTTLSVAATHAVQTLLWKHIDYLAEREQYDTASDWCRLLFLPAFESVGELNEAKIHRKMMGLTLAAGRPSETLQIYNQMPEDARNSALTQYLTYRTALREGNEVLATTSLERICGQPTKDATILYACVLEAQALGDRRQAITALQQVTKKFSSTAPEGVHLPALLRCCARLLMSEIQTTLPSTPSIVTELCELFYGASSQAQKERDQRISHMGDPQFTSAELHWFMRNAYNLSLTNYGEWASEQVMLLLEACLKLQELVLNTIQDRSTLTDIRKRMVVIAGLMSQCTIKTARKEDEQQKKFQLYLRVHQQVDHTRHSLGSLDACASAKARSEAELVQIQNRLLRYDFEACVYLKLWDALLAIVEEGKAQDKHSLYEYLADMVLSSEAPRDVTVSVLERIIDTSAISSVTAMARWIRILYHLCSTNNTAEKAGTLLERATTLADSAPADTPYPQEELEWLATTTFNRAVDAYCVNEEADCRKRMDEALKVAKRIALRDGGRLRDEMAKRASSLLGVAGGVEELQ